MNVHVECTGWRPYEQNTLKGFASFYISAVGLSIKDCAVHERSGQAWVQLPAKPRLDQDRNLVRDPKTQKIEYVKILSFEERAHADAFRDAAIKALMKREPAALVIRELDESPPVFV